MSPKTTLARRDFLKRVAAAGAAFSLPTHSDHARVRRQRRRATASTSGRSAAATSAATITSATLSAMPDVRIVAVADAYKSRREAAAARLNQQYGGSGTVKAYADFREILARARRGRRDRRRPRQLAHADVGRRAPGRQGRLLPETAGAGFRP